jgi:hypothetical protein
MPRCPLLLTVFSLLLLAMARPTKAQGIRLRNLEDGATLRYPAPILAGTTDVRLGVLDGEGQLRQVEISNLGKPCIGRHWLATLRRSIMPSRRFCEASLTDVFSNAGRSKRRGRDSNPRWSFTPTPL